MNKFNWEEFNKICHDFPAELIFVGKIKSFDFVFFWRWFRTIFERSHYAIESHLSRRILFGKTSSMRAILGQNELFVDLEALSRGHNLIFGLHILFSWELFTWFSWLLISYSSCQGLKTLIGKRKEKRVWTAKK